MITKENGSEICLSRTRGTGLKGGFLETIATCAPGQGHFIDIPLVYWKALAHLQAELIINTAVLLSLQHGAGENESAALSALTAFPFS